MTRIANTSSSNPAPQRAGDDHESTSEATAPLDQLAAPHEATQPGPVAGPVPEPASKTQRIFRASSQRWLSNPVLDAWRLEPGRFAELLDEVDTLRGTWSRRALPPFAPHADANLLRTGKVASEAGLPWFNNGILMPDESPGNWPFHFKEIEIEAVRAKAHRAGLPGAVGYVCGRSEANQFGIRAIAQQLIKEAPEEAPVLVFSSEAEGGVLAAAAKLGLQSRIVACAPGHGMDAGGLQAVLADLGTRPVILVATVGGDSGGVDDARAAQQLLRERGGAFYIHVDAARSFDFLNAQTPWRRATLQHPLIRLDAEGADDENIHAASLCAGGLNRLTQTVALKRPALGNQGDDVEYVQGRDSTIAGSRDALAGLFVGLQEMRFDKEAMRRMDEHCRSIRAQLCVDLRHLGIAYEAPSATHDLILEHAVQQSIARRFGMVPIAPGRHLLTVQPSTTGDDAVALVEALASGVGRRTYHSRASQPAFDFAAYTLAPQTVQQLTAKVAEWTELSRSSAGYPGNHATLSAMGPVFGRFLNKPIPQSWAEDSAKLLLEETKAQLDVPSEQRSGFVGCITTGSTLGNQIGILTALAHFPNATVYLSRAAHYGVPKVIADHQELQRAYDAPSELLLRLQEAGLPRERARVIEVDDLGRMLPEHFEATLARDRDFARANNLTHNVILLATFGTTFAGGTDDLRALHGAAERVGVSIDYVHADGALDFGGSIKAVALRPVGTPIGDADTRLPVQGITVSHHKFPGLMVSGQVLCAAPQGANGDALVGGDPAPDPMAVFEYWLYRRMFTPADVQALTDYCLANATQLRTILSQAGFEPRYNEGSIITLLDALPPWIVDRFNLSPQHGRVHVINMPHVTPQLGEALATAMHEFRQAQSTGERLGTQALGAALRLRYPDARVRALQARDASQIQRVADCMRGAGLFEESSEDEAVAEVRRIAADCCSFVAEAGDGAILGVLLGSGTSQRHVSEGVLLTLGENPDDSPNVGRALGLALKALGIFDTPSEYTAIEARLQQELAGIIPLGAQVQWLGYHDDAGIRSAAQSLSSMVARDGRQALPARLLAAAVQGRCYVVRSAAGSLLAAYLADAEPIVFTHASLAARRRQCVDACNRALGAS